jgi:hypothetical protein
MFVTHATGLPIGIFKEINIIKISTVVSSIQGPG